MRAAPPSRRVLGRRAAAALAAAALLAVAWLAALRWVPFPDAALRDVPSSVLLTDREGAPIRLRLAPGGLDARPGYVPDRDDWIARAIVAAEDKRFWTHGGLDFLSILRAAVQDAVHLRRVSGASTLSTQVIRMAVPRPRTLPTKVFEAFQAFQLERRMSKEEILRQYLDRAPFGGNIVGAEAAARRYFGKGARDLSLGEAALLAGLPQSPSRLRPDRHPAAALRRRAYVLDRMEACGMITAAERAVAGASPVGLSPGAYPFRAPHFCDAVGVPVRPRPGDCRVRTTLDPVLQGWAEDALARRCAATGVPGGAVVVLETATGAVRAMVGSPDWAAPRSGQVNGALAPRAAGSTLKPFAYALAFDRGRLAPASLLPDRPVHFRDLVPLNFSRDFRGTVRAREALVQSLNLPALEVERRAGQPAFHALLRRLGLSTVGPDAGRYGLGLVLGNAEVRLLDLANAYACLARGGRWLPPRTLEDAPAPDPAAAPVLFSPEAAWLVSDMLSGDERAMDATGHAADVPLPRFAWKTGTSAGFRDAWTVAWNPEYVIGVWMGRPDGAPSDALVGRLAATPLAWDLVRRLYPRHRDAPWHVRPAGLVPRTACADSGCVATPACPRTIPDWSIEHVTRREMCPLVHGPEGPDAADGPASASPAAAADRLPPSAVSTAAGPSEPVRILSPADGSTYRLLPGVDGVRQRLALSAAADSLPGDTVLHWFVDHRPVGTSRPGETCFWPLSRGRHRITCAAPGHLRAPSVNISVE